MENESKSSGPRDRDRLSELHDSLIFNIFEFLPMKYVVRTQILSHRWKNLWTLTPYLYFQNEDDNNIAFRNFVNRVLLSWRGTRVHKFKVSDIACEGIRIHGDDDCEHALFVDIDSWLRFAVDNEVEELDLSSYYEGSAYYGHHRVPQFLYSCSSLKKLLLSGSIIEITGKAVEWNQLLSLTVKGFQVTAHAVEQILCGSPLLEVFDFSFEQSDHNVKLNFQSSSLKVLSICKIVGDHDSRPAMDSELIISTPNLKSLRISGMPYGKCLLKNISCLAHVTLWFFELYDWYEPYGFYEGDDPFRPNEYLEESLSQILPAIQHVEGLTLSDWCIQVLINMNNKSLLSPFSNVKFLSLNGNFDEVLCILRLLEVFPELETLVLKKAAQFYVDSKSELRSYSSIVLLKALRTVVVTWGIEENTCSRQDFSIFQLIKSLLKNARKLERMEFRIKDFTPELASTSWFLASQKLLRMPRSSPTAELIFFEN